MRVLHLVDGGDDSVCSSAEGGGYGALAMCAAAIADVTRDDHEVCLIGGTRCERMAHRLGLRTTDRVAPPLGVTELAWPGINSLLRDRGFFDAVVCWSPRTHRLMDRTRAKQTPRVAIMPMGVGPVRETMPRRAYCRVVVVADDARRSRAWASELASVYSAMASPPPVLPPALDLSRDAWRKRLEIVADDFAIALVGHCAMDVDALRCVQTVSLLASAGERVVCVIPRGSGRLHRALRCAWGHVRVIVTDAGQLEFLSAADAGLWTGPPPDTQHRARFNFPEAIGAWGAQLGVPIVAATIETDAETSDAQEGSRGYAVGTPIESAMLSTHEGPEATSTRRLRVPVRFAAASAPASLAHELLDVVRSEPAERGGTKAAISTFGVVLGEAVGRAIHSAHASADAVMHEAPT